ncbi:aldehyde dehydrogenase family 3 member B1-like protein [Glomus cerebriforme]|uniref:Aldehyde dehydrogenase n=1 Tax=Glomus cerebriforme TaxID=658196 RepID=A0A397TUM3_9GLOM|nr:aldehyde dehydrogenase family 3 member B1-like protein [Glomus cerebriforme]
MTLKYTAVSEFPQIIEKLENTFSKNLTKPINYRKKQLERLYNLLDENEQEICDALYKDLHKHKTESLLGEINVIKQDCLDAIEHLDEWASPEYVKVGVAFKLNRCHIRKDPVGLVLIIGAWNYPVYLVLLPLVGAIAAGCTAIIKPSELAMYTATIIDALLPKYLDQEAYKCINGGVTEVTELLKYKFDHIFYTGSGAVGKKIMLAASNYLTPVTLELGGKSPAILDDNINFSVTAKRLIWAKSFNSGQTCIAPDYILCTKKTQEALLKEIPKVLRDQFGNDIQKSPDYARIINHRHFDRLVKLLEQTKGNIVIGGKTDRNDLFIEPTFVENVLKDDKLMEDEIFGPIFPIVIVENIKEAVKFINEKDFPLSLYPFSNDNDTIKFILDNTRSGGVTVNDCLIHATVPTLPFGGIGASGTGSYHGRKSFEIFTHERSVLKSPFFSEKLLERRYAPYNELNYKILNWLMFSKPNFTNKRNKGKWKINNILGVLCIIIVAYFVKKKFIK